MSDSYRVRAARPIAPQLAISSGGISNPNVDGGWRFAWHRYPNPTIEELNQQNQARLTAFGRRERAERKVKQEQQKKRRTGAQQVIRKSVGIAENIDTEAEGRIPEGYLTDDFVFTAAPVYGSEDIIHYSESLHPAVISALINAKERFKVEHPVLAHHFYEDRITSASDLHEIVSSREYRLYLHQVKKATGKATPKGRNQIAKVLREHYALIEAEIRAAVVADYSRAVEGAARRGHFVMKQDVDDPAVVAKLVRKALGARCKGKNG